MFIMEFATKRDINGNRYYLGVNPDNKTFSRERSRWYSREDITEIGKRDRRVLIDRLEKAGYVEIDRMEV